MVSELFRAPNRPLSWPAHCTLHSTLTAFLGTSKPSDFLRPADHAPTGLGPNRAHRKTAQSASLRGPEAAAHRCRKRGPWDRCPQLYSKGPAGAPLSQSPSLPVLLLGLHPCHLLQIMRGAPPNSAEHESGGRSRGKSSRLEAWQLRLDAQVRQGLSGKPSAPLSSIQPWLPARSTFRP